MITLRSLGHVLKSSKTLVTSNRQFHKSALLLSSINNEDPLNFKIGDILSSNKLNTPSINAVPSMYRCFVNDPVIAY